MMTSTTLPAATSRAMDKPKMSTSISSTTTTTTATTSTTSTASTTATATATAINNNKPKRIRKEQIEELIVTLARFKPRDCTNVQFYNYVRECCIIYNCNIKEAINRTRIEWRKLNPLQQKAYSSKLHALLPIPVPLTAIYEALKEERQGRIALAKADATRPRYVIESYTPQIRKKAYHDIESKVMSSLKNNNNMQATANRTSKLAPSIQIYKMDLQPPVAPTQQATPLLMSLRSPGQSPLLVTTMNDCRRK